MSRPSTVNEWFPGNVIRLQGEFTNTAGAAADPSAYQLIIESPDGTEYTSGSYVLTSTVTGTWYYDFTIPDAALAGEWAYMIRGTAGVIALEEWKFRVLKSRTLDNTLP